MQKRKQRIVLKNFTFNVGELIIEQETDESELSMPDTALKAISSVVSTPQRLMGIEVAGTTNPPINAAPSMSDSELRLPKQRRRRRSTRGSDEGSNGMPGGGASDSVPGHILELKQEGYFKQERDTNQVLEKLHQKGHTAAKNPGVSMALLNLTRAKDQAKKLYRRKENKKWTYRDTAYEHD